MDEHAPGDRSNYLRAYLNARLNTAEALLIAEAPGYQGAKFSGIAMTCERTILGHRRPWVSPRADAEIRSNQHVLEAFLRLFPDRPILSIGNISEEYLTKWGHRYELLTRHPANGGGAEFRRKFTEFLNTVGLLA